MITLPRTCQTCHQRPAQGDSECAICQRKRLPDLAIAYKEGDAYQAECPTTHQLYISTIVRHTAIGTRAIVNLVCACCDAERHTGEACDPRAPQWHMYFDGGAL